VRWSDTTIVDDVDRPVRQMPYPVYSQPMELLLELISELGLIVPFDWKSWDSTATVSANGWRTHRLPTLSG